MPQRNRMARHNEVRLLGYIPKEPSLYYGKPKGENLVRVTLPITTIRGKRDFGSKDARKRDDTNLITTLNPMFMQVMSKYAIGDIIDVKGNLITQNTLRNPVCPYCGEVSQFKDTVTFINPIYINRIYSQLRVEEAEQILRKFGEVANNVTVIGECCRVPERFSERKKRIVVNYQLDVIRKYKIREDESGNKHDFPNVKCYGDIAENDFKYIQYNSRVFIDGFVQSRNHNKKHKCEHCGHEIVIPILETEVVPYSTEYLSGCGEGYEAINEMYK